MQVFGGHQFPDGIDPYVIPGNNESGLLWGISNATLAERGSGDKKMQSYNYRICLTNNATNRIEITKPDNYNASHFELFLRLINKTQPKAINQFLKQDLMPNHKTDFNNNGAFSTDMIGMNNEYPDGSYETRQKIIKQHEDYNKGFLYFIGNDPRVPEHLREEMKSWGYPKDEYTDTGHWSHQLYVRESRRMIGEYLMTESNGLGTVTVSDGIAMSSYRMDAHNAQRVVVNGHVKNEGDVQWPSSVKPFPVSYRALLPKKTECVNVLVPVCLSATHIVYGSIRMEYTFMELGEASAVAAVMAIDNKTDLHNVDVNQLKEKLGYDF